MSLELSIPLTISDLIKHRAEIIQSWNAANLAIASIDSAFGKIDDKDFHFYYDAGCQRFEKRQDPIDVPEMTCALDYSLYVYALEKLNITKAMTGKAKEDFLKQVKEKKTIFDEQQLTGLAQNAHVLFRDSSLNTVRQVYRQLIGVQYAGMGAKWGENKKDNLQKIERVFRVGWSDIKLETSWAGERRIAFVYRDPKISSSCFHFNDLLTACRLIEGEGFTDYSNNIDFMIRSLPSPNVATLDCGYFELQAFLNGNVKVNWNEEKIHILEKLNAIGSGRENDLPDSMRKRYKPEHFSGAGQPEAEEFFKADNITSTEPSQEKDFAFFPTPESVAKKMVALGDYDLPGLTTLEPSAGDGGLLRFTPVSDERGLAIEFNYYRHGKLREEFSMFWEVKRADFLALKIEEKFDRVLMNPPFNDRIEAYHVVKAFGHLKPGGILVAIIPEGWFFRDDLKSKIFRAFLSKYEHKESVKLEAGTFKKTQVVTRIVVLKKV